MFDLLQPLTDLLAQQRDQMRELERKHGRMIGSPVSQERQGRGSVPPLRDHVGSRFVERCREARGASRRGAGVAACRAHQEGHNSGTIGRIITIRASRNELSKSFQQAKFDTSPTR
jgi:hypothetical protein